MNIHNLLVCQACSKFLLRLLLTAYFTLLTMYLLYVPTILLCFSLFAFCALIVVAILYVLFKIYFLPMQIKQSTFVSSMK